MASQQYPSAPSYLPNIFCPCVLRTNMIIVKCTIANCKRSIFSTDLFKTGL